MFYCEPCEKKYNWPNSFMKSRGKCEMCDNVGVCNDVPSKYLPAIPQPRTWTKPKPVVIPQPGDATVVKTRDGDIYRLRPNKCWKKDGSKYLMEWNDLLELGPLTEIIEEKA